MNAIEIIREYVSDIVGNVEIKPEYIHEGDVIVKTLPVINGNDIHTIKIDMDEFNGMDCDDISIEIYNNPFHKIDYGSLIFDYHIYDIDCKDNHIILSIEFTDVEVDEDYYDYE